MLEKNALMENNLTANEIEGYRKPLLEGKTNSLYTFFSSTCNDLPDYSKTIKNINLPSIVIWGKHDEMLQWTPMQEAVTKDLKVSPENIHMLDSKHYIQEESTEEILSYLLNFMK